MKPGSLVVVLPLNIHPTMRAYVKWLPVDDSNTQYVIREVIDTVYNTSGVYLEEGEVGHIYGVEIAIQIESIREIQAPGEVNVEALMEESKSYQLVESLEY